MFLRVTTNKDPICIWIVLRQVYKEGWYYRIFRVSFFEKFSVWSLAHAVFHIP